MDLQALLPLVPLHGIYQAHLGVLIQHRDGIVVVGLHAHEDVDEPVPAGHLLRNISSVLRSHPVFHRWKQIEIPAAQLLGPGELVAAEQPFDHAVGGHEPAIVVEIHAFEILSGGHGQAIVAILFGAGDEIVQECDRRVGRDPVQISADPDPVLLGERRIPLIQTCLGNLIGNLFCHVAGYHAPG